MNAFETARTLRNLLKDAKENADQIDLKLMKALVNLKSQKLLWGKHHKNWRSVLKEERFCGSVKYHSFEKGLASLTPIEGNRMSVTAIVGLGKLPPKNREKVVARLRKWSSSFKQPLDFKAYETFILEQRKLLGAGDYSRYPSPARMLKYIEALESKLKEHGIKLPKKTYVHPH